MKKKKLIIFGFILTSMLAVGVVFAAFIFQRVVDFTAETGNITLTNKYFYNYAYNDNMRVDSVYNVNGIEYLIEETYGAPSETTFQSSKTYYVKGTYIKETVVVGETIPSSTYYEDKNGCYELTEHSVFTIGTTYYKKESDDGYTPTTSVTIGNKITSGKYYILEINYKGITGIRLILDKEKVSKSYTIDKTKKKITIDNCIISCELNLKTGLVSATTNNKDYYVVINSDKTGFIVLNKSLENERKTINAVDENTTIRCSATVNKNDSNNIYLNQLGFGFEFTNTIPVYVRIHIQDAWILTKQYSSTKKETYSIKDQISGVSPFAITDSNWYYNPTENIAYLKQIVAESEVDEESGNLIPSLYYFNVNQAYYYIPNSIAAYTEYMDVQVSFTVDIVQANRAKAVWGIDPITDLA